MPIRDEFIDIMSNKIASHSDLIELRLLLISFKNKGLSKDEMLSYLNELRLISNEDIILELMDFVEGYCNPQMSIY